MAAVQCYCFFGWATLRGAVKCSKERSKIMKEPMGDARGLSSAMQFRPWPIWDPVPWLIDLLEREQLVQIARVQLRVHRENLENQMKAIQEIEKILGR
jgi:hypothetical protein